MKHNKGKKVAEVKHKTTTASKKKEKKNAVEVEVISSDLPEVPHLLSAKYTSSSQIHIA